MDDEGLLSPIMVERQASKSPATNDAVVPTLVQSDPSTPIVESTTQKSSRRSVQKRKPACVLPGYRSRGWLFSDSSKNREEPLEQVTPAKKAKTSKSSLPTPATADAEEGVKPLPASGTLKPRQAKVAERSSTAAASPAALDDPAVDHAVEAVAEPSVDTDAELKGAAEEDDDPIRAERLRGLSGRNNANGTEVEGDLYPFGTLGALTRNRPDIREC
jgi:hypothetical protein